MRRVFLVLLVFCWAEVLPERAWTVGVSADLNGDGRVDGGDLATLTKQWMGISSKVE